MAVYQIVEIGSEVLREKAKEVLEVNQTIERLLDNLADTMYASGNGIGLAAPQIGIAKRAVVVDVGEGLIELINPIITEGQGEELETEGCLSIPGVTGDVVRAVRIRVQGLNRQGESVDFAAEGLFARALQHEVDHLEGVLFIDRAKKTYQK
ncbi:MAG: peptide deformylase [Desulfitobacteriaceae bacterium]